RICLTLLFHSSRFSFFFNDPPTPELYTLSLHDALPILARSAAKCRSCSRSSGLGMTWTGPGAPSSPASMPPPARPPAPAMAAARSEEHTSELQSRENLVCRLLLEKKKQKTNKTHRNRTR